MKTFNDVVTYVRNGVELPAIVVESREVAGEDRLQLVYLDPENGKQLLNTHGTISRAYAVPPLKDGAKNGWKDHDSAVSANPVPRAIHDPDKFYVNDYEVSEEFYCKMLANVGKLVNMPNTRPSPADLDAHADEQRAKEATTAEIEPIREQGKEIVAEHEHTADGGLTNVTDEDVESAKARNAAIAEEIEPQK